MSEANAVLVHHTAYATRDAAKRDLFAYIETYYNRQRSKSDRLAAQVIGMVEEEKLSYRMVAKRLDLSKNTVMEIMKRHRDTEGGHAVRSI